MFRLLTIVAVLFQSCACAEIPPSALALDDVHGEVSLLQAEAAKQAKAKATPTVLPKLDEGDAEKPRFCDGVAAPVAASKFEEQEEAEVELSSSMGNIAAEGAIAEAASPATQSWSLILLKFCVCLLALESLHRLGSYAQKRQAGAEEEAEAVPAVADAWQGLLEA